MRSIEQSFKVTKCENFCVYRKFKKIQRGFDILEHLQIKQKENR